ncbi:MAG: MFS transporter [Candidatus Kapabacteria bacterium]|jgi:MFS family permease|nr:MFS transporter [Candidatus Kapabacteria bacterium]
MSLNSASLPRSRSGFFYGWIVLGAVFLVYASGTIGVTTIPLLNVKLRTAFGWTHEQTVLGPSLLFLIMGLLSPLAGYLLDTLNPKRLMLIGWSCFIAALILYSSITSFWQYMAFYGLYALGSVCTGVIPGMFLISKWFKQYRGIATGIFTVGSSFGGTIFPRFGGYMLQQTSWQETALWLAGATAVFAIAPWFLIRLTPESMNTTPDGLPPRKEEEVQKEFTDETLQTALKTVEFYVILLVTALVWFSIQPLVQNLSFHLKDVGVESEKAGSILSILFMFSIAGKLFFGWLSDHADKKNILFAATLNLTLGAVLVRLTGLIHQEWLFYCAAIVYGLGFSGAFTMVQLLVAERYSKSKDFGKILGAVTTADSLAVVAGVYLLGSMRTALGNYDAAFTVIVVSASIGALGVLFLKQLGKQRTA